MAVQPLTQVPPQRERLIAAGYHRQTVVPAASHLARRRLAVMWSKWMLPVLALLLLASIAVWPELTRVADQSRVSFRRSFSALPDQIRLIEPRYRGVDVRGRPYTLTAESATQIGPQRVNLVDPKGDVLLQSGAWMMVESRDGVYMQHSAQLDLSGDATLYRDDGTVLRSSSAALELKTGAASSNDQTHAEGPFGTLDAQGFTVLDKGQIIQFTGPARLLLNGTSKP